MNPAKRDLFIVSALFLFMELAFIRWFPAQVLFLTFFTNTVLLAAFLGLSLGCLVARSRRNFLVSTPVLLLIAMTAAALMEWIRLTLQDVIDVGRNAASPQMVYFGTEGRVGDVASFVVPIELVAGLFFILIALTMIGPGQVLGQRFAKISTPVEAYMINVGGSLTGVLLFNLCSWWLSPVWWFTIVAAGLFFFLPSKRRCWPLAATLLIPFTPFVPKLLALGVIRERFPVEEWSPYYRINYSPSSRTIVVNLIGHQIMSSRNGTDPAYALPYLLNRDSGLGPFHDILIIGAGSGNDVSRALQWAAPGAHIDAVEIDPVIQSIGKRDHPDHPYQDPRVTVHLNDGRNFVRSSGTRYDLVVFALVDSLVLHSTLSNIRLESYLFTRESMEDVRRLLKPDGMFVMYNYFRQGWIVSRLAKTLENVYSHPPVVLTLPEQDNIRAEQKADAFTMFLAGPRSEAIDRVFHERGSYHVISDRAPSSASPNGFIAKPSQKQTHFHPANVEIPSDLRIAEDAWPFLYLHHPIIPSVSWRGAIVIGAISFAMLWIFAGRFEAGVSRSDGAMFWLGAGFMLLETKAVVHLALIFGSTWIVNTVVFAAVLVMILLANLWVLKTAPSNLVPYYVLLLVLLVVNVTVPLNGFLGLGVVAQGLIAGALVLSPVFCAGVIFASYFKIATQPERALAFNTAGAILGGLAENASMLIGFRWILAVAASIYLISWVLGSRSRSAALAGLRPLN